MLRTESNQLNCNFGHSAAVSLKVACSVLSIYLFKQLLPTRKKDFLLISHTWKKFVETYVENFVPCKKIIICSILYHHGTCAKVWLISFTTKEDSLSPWVLKMSPLLSRQFLIFVFTMLQKAHRWYFMVFIVFLYILDNLEILIYITRLYLLAFLYYRWKLNGTDVDIGMDFRYSVVEGSLLINNPNKTQDAGTYQCIATNSFGTIVSREARLQFACK